MKKIISCLLAAGLALGLSATEVFADEVDNPGPSFLAWYNNPGSPFVKFASGENVYSYNGSTGPDAFHANITSTGATTMTGSTNIEYPTSLSLGSNVTMRLWITNVTGTTDCTDSATPSPGACDVDWTITAGVRFFDSSVWTAGTCETNSFSIHVTGNWGNTVSTAFTIPALSGTGHAACGGFSSILNTWFDLGTSGATLSLYKFEGVALPSGNPLEGSP